MEKKYNYREYCYDLDFNFYHLKNNKLTLITRKEYKEKTEETDYIINKLRNSRFPMQQNDYFFYKVGYQYHPIDWKLFDLIKYFKKNKFISISSHLSKKINCHILFMHNNNLLKFIKNIFDNKVLVYERKDNTIIIEFNYNLIDWMCEKLKIKIPNKKKAHKGRRIIHPKILKEILLRG